MPESSPIDIWRTRPSEAQILRLEIWWQYFGRSLSVESMNECRNCGNCRYIDPDIAEKAVAPLKGEWYVCHEGMWGADPRGYVRWLRPRTIKYNLQPVKRIAHRCGVFKPLAETIVEKLTGG